MLLNIFWSKQCLFFQWHFCRNHLFLRIFFAFWQEIVNWKFEDFRVKNNTLKKCFTILITCCLNRQNFEKSIDQMLRLLRIFFVWIHLKDILAKNFEHFKNIYFSLSSRTKILFFMIIISDITHRLLGENDLQGLKTYCFNFRYFQTDYQIFRWKALIWL